MGIATIILFFVYFWGYGYSINIILRLNQNNFYEKHFMNLGIGAAALILSAMLFDLVGIPLDWKLFLLIATLGPIAGLILNYKKIRSIKLKIKLSDLNVAAVFVIFIASMYMYASGALSYPYLENDDPWGHASGSKYIAVEKTFAQPEYRGFQYMNPYPPSYDFLFGLLLQTESSLQWTIKFFNALIISLSLIFFYFFAKEFTQNRNKALIATAILAAVPAYLSHFIWAPALAMMMFFPALYSLEMIKRSAKWVIVCFITIGGLLVSHPTHVITLMAMILIYTMVKFVWASGDGLKKAFLYPAALFGGILTSMLWWAMHGKAFFIQNILGSATNAGFISTVGSNNNQSFVISLIANVWEFIPKIFYKWSGTATRAYTFDDFFVAKGQNLINNPVGFGIVACILAAIGLIYVLLKLSQNATVYHKIKKENYYLLITVIWFAFTFTLVNNITFNLPIGWFAFRTWMILAVPVSILAAEGLWGLYGALSFINIDKSKIFTIKTMLVFIVLIGIFFTSAQQKYEVNTATWPPGAFWTSNEEITAYVWLKNLPPDTRVISYRTDDQIIGMDKYSCGWCKEVFDFRKKGMNQSALETADWMNTNNYEYLIISGMDLVLFGQNKTIDTLNELQSSGLFSIAYQNNAAVILKVV